MSAAALARAHLVHDFGCRLNIAEGERIRQILKTMPGHQPTIVINSCGVTAQAASSARSHIRRARRQHPDSRIIVTGCAAQIDPDAFIAMPEVDRVVGNVEKLTPDAYAPAPAAGSSRHLVGDIMMLARTAPQMLAAHDGHTRAFLDVQNGCDHRCTFCIIPFGRGPSRSSPAADVVASAERLVAAGRHEIVLTGVDLTSYGSDLADGTTLATLCRRLLDTLPALARLRLGSIDVAEIDDALFALLIDEARMMPHVHLSLQSGDDLILKRMKRRHRRADAVRLVERLRAHRGDIAIGADLIAGFPTEDDKAARNSEALIADCDIVFAHVFPYSPRPGTPAARMPQVDRSTVRLRAARLREVAAAHQQRRWRELLGTTQQMLVESDGIGGHIGNFARMRIDRPAPPGTIISVQVYGMEGAVLLGRQMQMNGPQA